ncbi:FAD-dependent oxidoreductase (plasmid) [Ensifer adhaerens]|nr:FAD-dependent oxidoreductase [Ensifer adhaerens]MBW0367982.1 FAD-dependent oxidoreductase [Ensifer adhaerens]UCM24422.1 FAD-dependent oxidoreductase [Ensifer adhaerens]UTV40653.1 FAD-dependent oxidoreductase [Ensifer adhaerens]
MAFDYDILVIGGCINGCGITRDAAGRGHKVLLAKMNDLASGTSTAAPHIISLRAWAEKNRIMYRGERALRHRAQSNGTVEIDADSRVAIRRRGDGTLALSYHFI